MTEQEQCFNRQVNYFVMRYMWQVVRGRNSEDTIHTAFAMSRERYTRVINTGKIRYSAGELAGLQQLTGLREEIFTGEERFNCSNKNAKSGFEITEEDWHSMFYWRKNKAGENKQNTICALLKKVSKTDVDNNDFYRLCYFLRERKPAPIRSYSDELIGVEAKINGLTFEVLDSCDLRRLRALENLLESKQNMIHGIVIYKDERNKAKK